MSGGKKKLEAAGGSGKAKAQKTAAAAAAPKAASASGARLSDVAREPLSNLGPITGVEDAEPLSIDEAAEATGVKDMDSWGYTAMENGQELSERYSGELDANEAGAFYLYTAETELYTTLNTTLRAPGKERRTKLVPFLPYLRLLLLARRKLQPYSGVVWRGVKDVDLRDKYPKGKSVYWWAFSSTTKQLDLLEGNTFLGSSGVRTQFMIEVSTGVDIERYSYFQGDESEAEVLLYPGTKLMVVGTANLGGNLFQERSHETVKWCRTVCCMWLSDRLACRVLMRMGGEHSVVSCDVELRDEGAWSLTSVDVFLCAVGAPARGEGADPALQVKMPMVGQRYV